MFQVPNVPLTSAFPSEYRSWFYMIDRCQNPKANGYHRYGGRGIVVCERWLGPQGFRNFLTDMGPKLSKDRRYLDRKNNDGNYEPGNCRWATQTEQQRNRSTNLVLTYKGESLTVTEWAERSGFKLTALVERHRRGWTVEQILETPLISCRAPRLKQNYQANLIKLTHADKTMCLSEWAKETGIHLRVIRDRYHRGWSAERILTTPHRPIKRRG